MTEKKQDDRTELLMDEYWEELFREAEMQDLINGELFPEELENLQEYTPPVNPMVMETLDIIDTLEYRYEGIKVKIPDRFDFAEVEVISPQRGQKLLKEDLSKHHVKENCKFRVTNEDSFESASKLQKPMVMNFANAYVPGGGFLSGAIAQEEALCRNSTLYASLVSEKATVMYDKNNMDNLPLNSDYMLYSPNVCVFRDKKGALLKRPFLVSVSTLPAPNRMGEAMFETDEAVNQTMKRRIRIMLRNAIRHGNRDIVLGAWGCGVFGNEPKDVAKCFRDVLVKEGYAKCFRNVNFAIFGDKNSKNIVAFKNVFSHELGLDKKKIRSNSSNNMRRVHDIHTKVMRLSKNRKDNVHENSGR